MNRFNKKHFSILTLLIYVSSLLLASVQPVFAATYSYDANGNMTSDGTKCYTYNEANQLKSVKQCSNSQLIAEYVYDYQGKRVKKKEYESGTLKRTVYSPDDEYETVKLASNSATENTTYYKVNDEVVARKNPDSSTTYYHTDHLGSASVLTNQSGAVVEKTTYGPYGEVKSGGTKSKFQYTGQEKDLETGLNYYGARYYNSHIHRFTQADTLLPDPYDPQQLNRYAYTRNNPLRYTDPTGHYIETGLDIAFLAVDIKSIKDDPGNPWNWAALAADGLGTAVPVGTGFGLGVRTIQHGVDIRKTATLYPNATQTINRTVKAAQDSQQFPQIKQGSAGGSGAGKRYIPVETRKQVKLENPQNTCVFCHMYIVKTHMDHAVPVVNAGNNTLKNIQLTCQHCNLSKGSGTHPKSAPKGFKGIWPPSWWGK